VAILVRTGVERVSVSLEVVDVSVVIPTFDRGPLLARALRSVMEQSRPADEVIVVDDGSTDGTPELVAREFPEVEYLRQSNRGVSAARNLGIRAARGSWIALLDSDDEWLPGKLERQLAALEESPGELLCHCDEIWVRSGVRVNPRARHEKRGGRIFRDCLALCVISPSAAVIHRSVFDEIGLFDEELPACEDYDLWLRLCARFPVLYVSEPLLVKHGGRPDQLSASIPALDRYRVHALAKILGSGVLSDEDAAAARRTLERKARIFAAGARKRGRDEEAERVLELAARFREVRDSSGVTAR
jgi:glycosyltransferase involved in cell wall biosynthesis